MSGDRFHAVEADQGETFRANEGIAQAARQGRQRKVGRRGTALLRLGAGRQQQVRLAAARGSGQEEPVLAFSARNLLDQRADIRLADESVQALIGRETQRERKLRSHTSGRAGGTASGRSSRCAGSVSVGGTVASGTSSAP